MSERRVPPGGEAKIDVTVNTRGRRGKLTKTVRVYTDDPKQRQATLTVVADIDAPELPPAKPPLKGSAAKRPPAPQLLAAPPLHKPLGKKPLEKKPAARPAATR